MAVPLRRVRSVLSIVALAGVALLGAGCGSEDGIQSYKVPKNPDEGKTATEYRILGAVYPADSPVWYFKFAGTADQVAGHEAEFDKVAASVRLQADPTALPAFNLPAGWTKTGPRTVTRGPITTKIDETLRFGPPDAPQEVTITYVPGGGLVQNLDRWAGQVGIDFDADDVPRYTSPFDATGGKGLRVDLRGPKNPASGPMMGKQR
ncbi:MAG: hypothetical protein JWO38_5312 [Gemmataceae bacterium]|nr:hypothetical protein [Gemmataceae bacterium]